MDNKYPKNTCCALPLEHARDIIRASCNYSIRMYYILMLKDTIVP